MKKRLRAFARRQREKLARVGDPRAFVWRVVAEARRRIVLLRKPP